MVILFLRCLFLFTSTSSLPRSSLRSEDEEDDEQGEGADDAKLHR